MTMKYAVEVNNQTVDNHQNPVLEQNFGPQQPSFAPLYSIHAKTDKHQLHYRIDEDKQTITRFKL